MDKNLYLNGKELTHYNELYEKPAVVAIFGKDVIGAILKSTIEVAIE